MADRGGTRVLARASLLIAVCILVASCGASSGRSADGGSTAAAGEPGPATPDKPASREESLAATNAACVEFYKYEKLPEPGPTAPVSEMRRYARGRVRSLAVGVRQARLLLLRRQAEPQATLVRDNFSRARAVYQQVVALPPDTPAFDVRQLMIPAQRLVVEAAVDLITYGATRCAPPVNEPPGPPGAGAGPLIAVRPSAVIEVGDPLLDNKSIVADRHAVWVAVAREPSIVRVNPKTNKVVARVRMPSNITQPIQLIDGHVWVATLTELVRVDPDTNRIGWRMGLSTLGPPDSTFTVRGDTLWACDHDVLHRISVRTGRRAPDVRLPSGCQGLIPSRRHVTVAYTFEGDHNVVAWLDPVTGKEVASSTVGGSVWGMHETSSGRVFTDLTEVGVRDGRVLWSVPREGSGGNQIAVADGAVWVTRPVEQRIVRYDLDSKRLEEFSAGPGVNGIAAAGDTIWVTNSDAGTIMRFPVDLRGRRN
jgi:hypothetical protein